MNKKNCIDYHGHLLYGKKLCNDAFDYVPDYKWKEVEIKKVLKIWNKK